MPKHKLKIIIAQILFSNLTDNSFELDNHKHFFLVWFSSAEIESSALELENSVSLGLEELLVVKEGGELICAIFRFCVLHHCCITILF